MVASLLLVFGAAHYVVWKLVSVPLQGHVYTATGALAMVVALVVIGLVFASPEVLLVVALLGGFALQVVVCNAWFIVSPWPTQPGSALCSSGLHFPVGLVGLWCLLYVAHWIHRKGEKP